MADKKEIEIRKLEVEKLNKQADIENKKRELALKEKLASQKKAVSAKQ